MGQQRPKNNKEIIDPVEQAALKNALNNFYAARDNGDVEQIINKNSSTPLGTPIQQQTQFNPQYTNNYQNQPPTQQQPQQPMYQPLANQQQPQTTVPTP